MMKTWQSGFILFFLGGILGVFMGYDSPPASLGVLALVIFVSMLGVLLGFAQLAVRKNFFLREPYPGLALFGMGGMGFGFAVAPYLRVFLS